MIRTKLCARAQGHFCPLSNLIFFFQFFFYFWEKTFWYKIFDGPRKKIPGFHHLFSFLLTQPNIL